MLRVDGFSNDWYTQILFNILFPKYELVLSLMPDLTLGAAGIAVSARRIQGGEADTVIKLRPVVPDELPKDIRQSESMKVVVNILPGRFVASSLMKGKTDPDDVNKAVAGELDCKEFFEETKGFFKIYKPDNVKISDMVPLGPILTLKLKIPEEGPGRGLAAEAWFYRDNSRILELSTKCKPDETFQLMVDTKSFLQGWRSRK